MFILKNVNIPYNGKWKRQDVAIDNGIYVEIADSIDTAGKIGRAIKTISLNYESYLIPSMIDPHVHVREPGFDYKEDWSTCSRAALKGGVSLIIDMPNNKVPIDDFETLKIKDSIAFKKSYTDYGLYLALTDDNADKIADGVFEDYVCGVKIYMAKTTGNLIVDSLSTIKKSLYQNRPVLVHTGGGEGLLKLMKAVEEVYSDRKKIPTIYICHVSNAEEVEILKKYKSSYPDINAEVTPHHLFLNKDDYKGPKGVLPPLGSKDDQMILWNSLLDGTIDLIGTDHAPHTFDEKTSNHPPSGFPGLETALPLLFDALIDGKLQVSRLIEITSIKASEIFNIKGYGKIEVGKPANCALIIRKDWKIGEDGYQTKSGWSPFENKLIKSKVYLTVVNGNISYFNGEFSRGKINRVCRK